RSHAIGTRAASALWLAACPPASCSSLFPSTIPYRPGSALFPYTTLFRSCRALRARRTKDARLVWRLRFQRHHGFLHAADAYPYRRNAIACKWLILGAQFYGDRCPRTDVFERPAAHAAT